MFTIDPNKIGLLDLLKTPGVLEAYRAWSQSADTLRFLTLAAEIVLPAPSSLAVRSSHPEAVAALVRKETVEEFSMACLQLERYAEISGSGGLPEPTYGAVPPQVAQGPQPSPRRRKRAEKEEQK